MADHFPKLLAGILLLPFVLFVIKSWRPLGDRFDLVLAMAMASAALTPPLLLAGYLVAGIGKLTGIGGIRPDNDLFEATLGWWLVFHVIWLFVLYSRRNE